MWILGIELMFLSVQGKHNFTDGALSSALVSIFYSWGKGVLERKALGSENIFKFHLLMRCHEF